MNARRTFAPVLLAATALLLVLPGCCGELDPWCCERRCCPPRVVFPDGDAAPRASITGVGFLPDYAKLQPDPENPGGWFWLKPGMDLRAYDALLIDPVELIPMEGSEAGALEDEVQGQCRTAFREILVDRIDPYYSVVDEPAPHVLQVRIAITDIQPAVEAVEGDVPVQVGGASIEVEILDAQTGETLAMGIDRIEGSTRGEVAEDEWKPVEGAFREWADQLLDFVDSYHEAIDQE